MALRHPLQFLHHVFQQLLVGLDFQVIGPADVGIHMEEKRIFIDGPVQDVVVVAEGFFNAVEARVQEEELQQVGVLEGVLVEKREDRVVIDAFVERLGPQIFGKNCG